MKQKILIWLTTAVIGAVSVCWGQTTILDPLLDPLHGCIIGTTCFDNGTVTPTTTNPLPNFTFTVSSGPLTGDWLIGILIPNDATNAATKSYSISGTNGGPTDSSAIPSTSAASKGNWTGLDLSVFLSLPNTSPANPLSAWLTYTQGNNCGAAQNSACDPGATGYYVYQVDLGSNQLQSPSNPTVPILTLSGDSLPVGSVIASFLSFTDNKGTPGWIATAPSGGIFEAGDSGGGGGGGGQVPEPYSIVLFGTLTLGVVTSIRRKLNGRV